MPLTHVGGLSILVRSAIYGTTAVRPRALRHRTGASPRSAPGRSDAREPRRDDARAAARRGLAAPARVCARADRRRTGPRGRCASAPRAAGVPVALTYGLTEACSQVTTTPAAAIAGRPAARRAAAVLHARCRSPPTGRSSSRGPTVARRRARRRRVAAHRRPRRARRATATCASPGRAADTIVSGGENVAPAQVEAVLEAPPGACSRPASRASRTSSGGRSSARVVVARDGRGVEPEELREFCAATLARLQGAQADRASRASRCRGRDRASCCAGSSDEHDPDEQRSASLESWEAAAPGWVRRQAAMREFAAPVSAAG